MLTSSPSPALYNRRSLTPDISLSFSIHVPLTRVCCTLRLFCLD
uniref:Uncharacterized protein n=1 Tax=Anguilla anguilla TaxID=7936 RepID=A0A0E9QZC5_ANGAN